MCCSDDETATVQRLIIPARYPGTNCCWSDQERPGQFELVPNDTVESWDSHMTDGKSGWMRLRETTIIHTHPGASPARPGGSTDQMDGGPSAGNVARDIVSSVLIWMSHYVFSRRRVGGIARFSIPLSVYLSRRGEGNGDRFGKGRTDRIEMGSLVDYGRMGK